MLWTKTPDESGWYCFWQDHTEWVMMAHVDTEEDEVRLFDFEHPGQHQMRFARGHAELNHAEWYGPINSPFGEMGEDTVIIDQEVHQEAARLREAIVMHHVDYSHCPDGHGGSVTHLALMPGEEADKTLPRE